MTEVLKVATVYWSTKDDCARIITRCNQQFDLPRGYWQKSMDDASRFPLHEHREGERRQVSISALAEILINTQPELFTISQRDPILGMTMDFVAYDEVAP